MAAPNSHGPLKYDKLTDEQHAALLATMTGHYVVAGPSGSGRTSTAVLRALALSESGDKLTRPRPLILVQSMLRRRMVQQWLGESADAIDVEVPTAWIRREHERVTGRRLIQGEAVDWAKLAIELLAGGHERRRSVVVDDADQVIPEIARALALLIQSAGFCVESIVLDGGGDSTLMRDISPVEVHRLTRRFRNSTFIRRVAYTWGATDDLTEMENSRPGRAIVARKQSPLAAAQFAAKHWAADRTRQIAIVPMTDAHVTPIADFLLDAGFPQSRLFAGDANLHGIQRFDFLNGGIFVLNSRQIVGLGFDLVAVTGIESITGDLTSSTIMKPLLAIAAAARNDLLLTWWDENDEYPAMVRSLSADLYAAEW